MNERYYQPPTKQLGQGDILRGVPSLLLRAAPIEFVRRRQGQKGPLADIYIVGEDRQPTTKAFDPGNDEAIAAIQLANAIVLAQACDWDNSPTAPVPLALVRPLRTFPEDAHQAIRDGNNGRFLHLPANDDPLLEESYVDFSRTTSLRVDVVRGLGRVLSPTAELLTALYVALTYFYSRSEPNPVAVKTAAAKALREADE